MNSRMASRACVVLVLLAPSARETQIYSSRPANPALGGLLRWFFCQYSRYWRQQRSCSAD